MYTLEQLQDILNRAGSESGCAFTFDPRTEEEKKNNSTRLNMMRIRLLELINEPNRIDKKTLDAGLTWLRFLNKRYPG